jgi:hypothetical protein
MDHKQILGEAISILRDRDMQYGQMQDVVIRACEIFELTTGREMSAYHANMFMHSLKLARLRTSPQKPDNYVDGINYLAFAGEFAIPTDPADAILNAGMRDLINQLNTQEGNV